MSGQKYICKPCNFSFWGVKRTPCLMCGGPTIGARIKRRPEASCEVCGTMFQPRDSRHTTCSPECSQKKKLARQAEASLRRYYARKEAGLPRAHRATKAQPWAWLERTLTDDSERGGEKRKVLHVLEQQTKSGDWPYYDVLAGVGPSPIDECAFL